MSEIYKREIPLVITFIAGIIMVLEYYTVSDAIGTTADTVNTWRMILGACVYVGAINLFRLHARNVTKKRPGQWYYSAWLLFLIVSYAVLGLYFGIKSPRYRWMIDNVTVPLGATMYASLCFYMASGAYRVLKAKTLGTALLLASAFIVIMGNTPLFPYIWPGFGVMRNKIFETFVVGSYRAIRIGVGLGGVALGIRTLIGKETAYLGRKE